MNRRRGVSHRVRGRARARDCASRSGGAGGPADADHSPGGLPFSGSCTRWSVLVEHARRRGLQIQLHPAHHDRQGQLGAWRLGGQLPAGIMGLAAQAGSYMVDAPPRGGRAHELLPRAGPGLPHQIRVGHDAFRVAREHHADTGIQVRLGNGSILDPDFGLARVQIIREDGRKGGGDALADHRLRQVDEDTVVRSDTNPRIDWRRTRRGSRLASPRHGKTGGQEEANRRAGCQESAALHCDGHEGFYCRS